MVPDAGTVDKHQDPVPVGQYEVSVAWSVALRSSFHLIVTGSVTWGHRVDRAFPAFSVDSWLMPPIVIVPGGSMAPGLRILLVEDEVIIRKVEEKFLTTAGN